MLKFAALVLLVLGAMAYFHLSERTHVAKVVARLRAWHGAH